MEPRIETKPKTKQRFESISKVFLESILFPPLFMSRMGHLCNSNCRTHPQTQSRVLLLRALNSLYTLESAIRFFFCSKAPGLVFSTAYQQGSLTPSAFPSTRSGLRVPPLIRRENDSGLPPVTAEKPYGTRRLFPATSNANETIPSGVIVSRIQ